MCAAPALHQGSAAAATETQSNLNASYKVANVFKACEKKKNPNLSSQANLI